MSQVTTAQRTRALTLVALAELLAMGLWFGVSAVGPQIAAEWGLDSTETSWLTLAVQIGFVAGTLLSAVFNLPDVISARHLFAVCALLGAASNALLALFADGIGVAIALRFLTGLFLAGVYPPGMKIIAGWFRTGRGFALGVMVGALTLGKASPYLVNALGSDDWRANAMVASLLAIVPPVIILLFVKDGPHAMPTQPFDPSQIAATFTNRGVRLANLGYFGHMWELYAMWAWVPAMLRASMRTSGDPAWLAEAGAFAAIGAGAVGCVAAGVMGDRFGRPEAAAVAMAISGTCCLTIGLLFGGSAAMLIVVVAIWGASVVADSAQFSACVAGHSDPRYVGTALTIQTCIGFLITTVSIAILPPIVEGIGWRWAFVILAPGPFLGIIAMMRLRSVPS